MAAGDVTQGRRITGDLELHEWSPAAYGLAGDPTDASWYCVTPDGQLGNLSAHQVTEHDDGTITVQPSILVGPVGDMAAGWHGYLEHGVWREV